MNIIKVSVALAVSLSVVVGFRALTASPVVLLASYDSVMGYGEWLELRADGTFDHTSASLYAEDITHGRYTLTDSILKLDRLPKFGSLHRTELLVRASAAVENREEIWQVGPTGRVDSTLARLRIIRLE